MIHREVESKLLELAGKFPAVSVTGPRQSGKTTLVRAAFPKHEYLSFEDLDTKGRFEDDPRGFLARYAEGAIFDEAQRVPSLFSYLQHVIDDSDKPGRFILTGSQNFLLSKAVGQSLAGRVALFTLLPFSYQELDHAGCAPVDAASWVFRGGYPRLFDGGVEPADFFPSYVETYLQRDVREELGVRSLSDFSRFLSLCALSSGELLNVSSLASDCGVSVSTARGWLSILEASHIIYLLQPHYSNLRKRLVKRPKLYFIDSGLACNLIGIDSPDELFESECYGHLFESAVIAEMLKTLYGKGRSPHLAFWRDSNKNEIDLLVERGLRAVKAIEIKSSKTYKTAYFDVMSRITPDLGLGPEACAVVYGGEERVRTKRGVALPFRDVPELLQGGQ